MGLRNVVAGHVGMRSNYFCLAKSNACTLCPHRNSYLYACNATHLKVHGAWGGKGRHSSAFGCNWVSLVAVCAANDGNTLAV